METGGEAEKVEADAGRWVEGEGEIKEVLFDGFNVSINGQQGWQLKKRIGRR